MVGAASQFFQRKDDAVVYINAYNRNSEGIASLRRLGCDNEMWGRCIAQNGNIDAINALQVASVAVNKLDKKGRMPVLVGIGVPGASSDNLTIDSAHLIFGYTGTWSSPLVREQMLILEVKEVRRQDSGRKADNCGGN